MKGILFFVFFIFISLVFTGKKIFAGDLVKNQHQAGPFSFFMNEPKPPADSLAEQTLDEVVISAFNVSRRLLATPGSLTLIGFDQIEASRASTVLPLLKQASGVFAHAGTLSTSRITIRGIGAREPYATGKIRAYFNNIPLTNGSGISIVEHIDPSVIERIEIIKGPATSAYGAGLGGTILITARQPSQRSNGITHSFQAGSYGLLRNSLLLDGSRENLAGSLVYSRTTMDGYRQNSQYRRDAITGVGQFNMGKKARGTALLYYSDMKGHIPSSIDSLTFVNTPRAAAQNWLNARGYEDTQKLLAGVSATHQLNAELLLDISLFTTLHYEKERRPWDFMYEDRESGGTRAKLTWLRQSGLAQWRIMGGTELFFENFRYKTYENQGGAGEQGDIISNNREGIRFFNFFAQADLDFERLNVSAGLNANTNRINYQDIQQIGGIDRSDVYNYGFILSPRFSANYRLGNYHAIFATISHGFSPPALSETLTPEGFVNLDILPEKSWSYETGFRGGIFSNRLFYDLSLYRMHVKDLLVAERVGPDAWVGKNAGRSLHQGIEAELSGKLFQNTASAEKWHSLKEIGWRSAYSFNHYRFTDYVDRDVDFSGNRIPGIPAHLFNGGLQVIFAGGIYAHTNFTITGSMPMNDLNSRYSEGYFLLDARLGYKKDIRKWSLDVFGAVNNLTNQHYASMILVNAPSFGNALPRYYYPGLPVNFSFGLRLAYIRR
jgi:iron complex outermembrane receptor protein